MITTTAAPVWYRCRVGAAWRPAYVRADGVAYVAPVASGPWRVATAAERATFQRRIPQETVGRIFDDALYEVPPAPPAVATPAPSPRFRYLGTTDDVLTCGHCGRTDLSHTVVVESLDLEGNAEDVLYLGSTCAARYLSRRYGVAVSAADVRRGVAAATRAAEAKRRAELEAEHALVIARRDAVLRSRGIDPRTASVRECLAALALVATGRDA